MSYEKDEAKILLEKAQLELAIDRIIHKSHKLTNEQINLLEHTIMMEKIARGRKGLKMEDEEFEKYFHWIEAIYGTNYVRYSLGYFEDSQRREDKIKRKQKLKEILEEIYQKAYDDCYEDFRTGKNLLVR